jgi:hypothetical protein
VNFEDGTEVTDDCYLKCLPSLTILVALKDHEEWVPDEIGILEL